MSLHRITAGSGYDYLTRQVAAMDSTERGHTGLASYYTEKGEVPGQWVGSGLAGIDGLDAGDIVTAEQMLPCSALVITARRAALGCSGGRSERTEQDVLDAIRLGKPFAVHADDISGYRIEVARRLQALNLAPDGPTPPGSRSGPGFAPRSGWRFRRDFGRARSTSGTGRAHARLSRQKTTAVAGFDLTFSPSSPSRPCGRWPTRSRRGDRASHQASVADALRFIETHALFT